MIFSSLLFFSLYVLWFSSFWANPRGHVFYCRNQMVSVHSPFSKKTFFHEHTFRKVSKVSFIFASFFHQISSRFRYQFSHRFFHRLFMKKVPKMEPKSIRRGDHFGDLFATLSFMLILCWIWLTFDSHLAPFGSLWAPFCSHWAPFCSLLAYFWCPLAHFCSPGEPIFSLLLYPGLFLGIFPYFPRKYHAKSYF